MTARAQVLGWTITYSESRSEWLWEDTGEPIGDCRRACLACGLMPTPEGHDACLGTLPGVSSACCGHGVERPYTIADDATDSGK